MKIEKSGKVKNVGKILFVSPTGQLHGGGERSGLEFCKYLIRQGYEVITVLPKDSHDTYTAELDQLKMPYYHALYSFDNINSSFEPSLTTIREVFSVIDIVNKVKPNIIFSNMSAFTHGALASAMTNIPHIFMERGNGYRIEEKKVRKMLDFVFKYSNGVIVNSTGLLPIYNRYYDKKTAVARSFTDFPKIGLNNSLKETRVIAVSRLSPEKNIIELLRAMVILYDRYPEMNMRTVVMGYDGGSLSELQHFIESNESLRRQVDILDFDPNPWKSFGPNDIYVNTSLYESVGRSSIEALRLGLPVVLADIPGHSDIFDLVGGYKYRSGNPADLANQLDRIIHNKDEVADDTSRWKVLVSREFDEDRCYEGALELINRTQAEENPVSSSAAFNWAIDNTANEFQRIQKMTAMLREEVQAASTPGVKRSIKYLIASLKRKINKLDY